MSPHDPGFEDPFAGDDQAARERARRRAEREAKRRERDNRASLAERVSGAIDGATARGKEAIEQTRERARSPEPPGEGVEPPSFRRPAPPQVSADQGVSPAASPGSTEREPDTIFQRPGEEPGRLSAEEAMPRRESLFVPHPLDTGEADALAPEPVVVSPLRRPAGEGSEPAPPGDSTEWTPPPRPAGGRSRRAPSARGGIVWRRRLLALAAVVLLVAGAAFALSKVSGGDPQPAVAPGSPVKTENVSIPEGLTAEQIAEVAKDAGLKGDYMKAEKEAAKKFDVHALGGPKDATLEGFLFPATYEVEKGADVAALIDKQLHEGFEPNFAEVDMSRAKKANLTEFDIVTIASMIEREVQDPKERPIVAAVIYNRLQQGIPLEIDATVRYAIGNDYSKALTTADLAVDSCFNTYVNPGLPCGPISNPGLDSMKAAADPTGDDYLYYVVKPGTCPAEHFFTADYDEFVAASQEYDAAQAEAGGKPNC